MNDTVKITADELKANQTRFFFRFGAAIGLVLLIMALVWAPLVRPWSQERKGLANLQAAKYENLIQAEQSAAEREAAELRAQAIAIVGAVAKEYPEYRSQEFIGGFANAMKNGGINQTFYIPTRSSIPILPAMGQPQS